MMRFVNGLAMACGMMMVVACHGLRTDLSLDDERVTEVRQLPGFEKIEISGSPTVYYTQGDSISVTVEGPEKGVERIMTEVDNGMLRIRNRGKMGVINFVTDEDGGTTVRVCSPDLVGVTLNGSGDFVSQQRIDTDQMDIVLRGSGDITLKDLICDRCEVQLIGSGDIDLDRVETREVSAVLVGSGDIDLRLRNTISTYLSLKGSGDIDAQFSEGCKAVECELRGSGDINLEGEVSRFTKQQSGSGDVNVGKLTVRH
jgi:hypothetical protein